MWVRLGRVLLVLVVVALAAGGLTLSARGINSLTLDQPPLMIVQAADDVITVQTLGESFSISGPAIQEAQQGLGHSLQRQSWRILRQMGQALDEYTRLVY